MINLMQVQNEYGMMENPILITILLLIIIVPGFFVLGFLGSKVVTLFMISNKGSITFGILLSIIGLLFILVLGYTALNS